MRPYLTRPYSTTTGYLEDGFGGPRIAWTMELLEQTMDGGSPPSVLEPIDLETTKRVLRFKTASEDDLIQLWIGAAREYFELQTEHQCLTALRRYTLASAPPGRCLEVPFPPLQDVVSLSGLDPTAYTISSDQGPAARRGCVTLVDGASWPSDGSVAIEYHCGWGDTPAAVPSLVKSALFMLVGLFHKYRAELHEEQPSRSVIQLPLGAAVFLQNFKFLGLPSQFL